MIKSFGTLRGDSNVNKWKLVCASYGILSLLMLIDHLEAEENYEELKDLKLAIEDVYPGLPTRYTKEAIEMVKKDFNLEDSYVERSKVYVDIIINDFKL